MQFPEWPEAEVGAMRRGDSFNEGAAICRRGHIETRFLKPGKDRPVPEKCPECGARVLAACPECGIRIRGDYYVPGVIGFSKEKRPSFCDGCGVAFPWASREERIFELENLLDEEDIDEATGWSSVITCSGCVMPL